MTPAPHGDSGMLSCIPSLLGRGPGHTPAVSFSEVDWCREGTSQTYIAGGIAYRGIDLGCPPLTDFLVFDSPDGLQVRPRCFSLSFDQQCSGMTCPLCKTPRQAEYFFQEMAICLSRIAGSNLIIKLFRRGVSVPRTVSPTRTFQLNESAP